MTLTAQRNRRPTFRKIATASGGQFWNCDQSKVRLRELCLSFDVNRIKQADTLGGEQDTGFEQAFSSLAYAYIADKSPRLLDYVIGFQLVDRDEDNTKAMGIFGFKVGSMWLYAPVFFLNGDLKGHELLYIKNQDAFVPMKENWVNYLMSRKPHLLGEASEKDVFQLGGLSPNIDKLSWPPGNSKHGGDAFTSMMSPDQVGMVNNAMTPPPANPLPTPAQPISAGAQPLQVGQINPMTGGKVMTPPIPGMGVHPHGMPKLGFYVDDWAEDFLPPVAACATKAARFMWRDRKVGEKFSIEKIAQAPLKAALLGSPTLDTFLREDWQLAKIAFDWTKTVPGFKRGCEKFYGADFFQKLAAYHKAEHDALSHSLMPRPERRVKVAQPFSLLPPTEKKAVGPDKVRIVTKDDVAIVHNLPEISDDEKSHIMSHGYLVKDERTGEEITKSYNTQVKQTLSNPHGSGLYDVLEAPGSFDRMLVINNPIANDGAGDFITVVRVGSGNGKKAWLNSIRTKIFARHSEEDVNYRVWFKTLPEFKSLKTDTMYIGVNERGEGTVPFVVKKKYNKGDQYEAYRVDFQGGVNTDRQRADYVPLTHNSPLNHGRLANGNRTITNVGAMLVINGLAGTKLRAANGELYVPSSFRFIKLKDPAEPNKDDGKKDDKPESAMDGWGSDAEPKFLDHDTPKDGDSDGSDPKPIMPGDIHSIQLLFTQQTEPLKLLGDSHEVSIFSKKGHDRMSYGQAVFNLVRVHGLSELAARAMLKSAQHKAATKSPVKFRLKYADNYPQSGAGPTSPPVPAPQYGTEQIGYNSVNSIYPQQENIPVPGLEASRTDPRIYDPFLKITPDQNAMSFAQQASEQGQKEVFDTASISGLLKAVGKDDLVNKYLGDLMKSLDRLGRLLFIIYAHSTDFQDRYGKADMPDLEDSIRNSFSALGDLILFLKEKEIEPGIDDEMSPNIEESSRN